MNKAEEICQRLKIDYSQILNIYPYGSQVYGTATEDSDEDFVIVYKSSLLPSGAFKDNAISSEDKKIQGTCYSRSGFIDAINNYQICALECLYLPADKIVQQKMVFKMYKFDKIDFAKKIIETASSSWYHGTLSYRDGNIEYAKKNVFHAIRILLFARQIKKHNKIVDYTAANEWKKIIFEDANFKPRTYMGLFMKLKAIK